MNRGRTISLLLAAVLALVAISAHAVAPALNRNLLSADTYQRLSSAQRLLAGGDYAGALARLNSLLPRVQANAYELAVAEQNIAYVYITRGDYADALPPMLRAMQPNALPPEAQRTLVLDLANLYVRIGRYDDARQVLSALQQSGPVPAAEAEVLSAAIDAHRGRCRDAVPLLRRAVQQTAKAPESWYQLWLDCEYQLHDYAGATEPLYALLARWRDKPQYWRQLGQTYAQLHDNSRALAVFVLMYRQGLLRQQQDYLNLVSLYLQNREPYQAAQLLQAWLDAGTLAASEANYELLAGAWLQAKEQDQAIAALGRAAKLAQNGEPYLRQAELYQRRHEWFAVIGAAQQALAKGGLSHPGQAYLLQGVAQAENKQFAEAQAALKQAARSNDTRDQAQAWLRYVNARLAEAT